MGDERYAASPFSLLGNESDKPRVRAEPDEPKAPYSIVKSMHSAIILSYCSLRVTKVFILTDGTVQLARPQCSFWSDIFNFSL